MAQVARDERVDDLLVRGLSSGGSGGSAPIAGRRWLVSGDLPRAAAALADRGAEVGVWDRYAGGDPRPTPPAGPWDGAVIRPWRGRDATRMMLHLVAARLAPGAQLWACAANDEGGRSLRSKLAEVLEEVDEGVPGGHARRYVGRSAVAGLHSELEAWRTDVQVDLGGIEATLASWPGLFAHGRLDGGTALLLDHLPDPSGERVLDFACGAGAVGAALAARGAASLDLCDHDALALHAARINVPHARCWCVDGLPDAGPWDRVVSNPPIHRGSQRDLSVIAGLVTGVRGRLVPGAEVRLVVQATVPVPAIVRDAGGRAHQVATDRRFTVWAARWS